MATTPTPDHTRRTHTKGTGTMATTPTPDHTRRTLAQARRSPQWQRLIDSIHKAQAAKGYDGRQFGAAEMEHFGETLVGMPVERTVSSYRADTLAERRAGFAAYWVARQVNNHSDETESVRYVLKAVYGDDLANVHTIAEETAHTTGYDGTGTVLTPEWDAVTALDFVRRAAFQTGANR
jgi:hypothetical protein